MSRYFIKLLTGLLPAAICCNICAADISPYPVRNGTTDSRIMFDPVRKSPNHEKGFAGISFGLGSLNYSKGALNPGFRISIDGAYKISSYVGIAVLAFTARHNYQTINMSGPYRLHPKVEKEIWKIRSAMAGPLFSMPFGEKISWSISPMIGLIGYSRPYYYSDNDAAISADLNAGLSFHMGSNMGVKVSADFFLTEDLYAIANINLGLTYRFK